MTSEMGLFEAGASEGAHACPTDNPRGELAIGRGSRATDLYAVGSFDPDHDAVMRIGVGLHPRLTRGSPLHEQGHLAAM